MADGGAFLVARNAESGSQTTGSRATGQSPARQRQRRFHMVRGEDPQCWAPPQWRRRDLDDDGLHQGDLDDINAHGTGHASRRTFRGPRTHADPRRVRAAIPIRPPEQTGHLVGGAPTAKPRLPVGIPSTGHPPTINLDEVDPGIANLGNVAHQGRSRPGPLSLSWLLGFGGRYTGLICAKPRELRAASCACG